jgi:CrcB protein
MQFLIKCGWIALAGSVGAVLRFLVGRASGLLFKTDFPVGTFIINISGSLFLGWFTTYAMKRTGVSENLRLAIGVGFVGAYTTFSTYMYESNDLLRKGSELAATANLLGSMAVGLLAVRFGIWLAGS